MYDVLLSNATVITMDERRRVLDNGAVGIENGRIAFVGTSEEAESLEVKEVIDCKNHVVMPGFVDAHGHGGHSVFKSIVEDTSYWMPVMTHAYKNYITDEFWYNEGRLSALERLHAGVTTGVCVLGSQPRCDSPVPARNNAKAYAEVGVKDIVCTGPCHTPWPHRFSRYVDGVRNMREVSYEEVLESLETVISELNHANDDRTRAYVTPFGVVTSVDPSAPTPADRCVKLTDHDIRQAKEMRRIAEKYSTRIHTDAFGGMIHLAYQDKENALLGPDVHLQHCTGLSFDEAMILAKTNTHVSFAPGMGQIVNRTPVIELLNLGATVAITTDGSMLSSGFDMFDAMRRAQMIFRRAMNDPYYLPCEKLLEMTTIDAAKCVGMEKEVGSLEVGKRADIIVINLMNPRLMPRINIIDTLVGNGHPSDVDLVLVDGQIVLRDGKATTVNEEEVLLAAERDALETAWRASHLHPFLNRQPQWGNVKIYFDEVRFNMEENRRDGGHY